MVRLLMVMLVLVAALPSVAAAGYSTAGFRVGISIEYGCETARTAEASRVAIACDAPVATRQGAIAAGQAWPRPARMDPTTSRLSAVEESDQMRLIVVEY